MRQPTTRKSTEKLVATCLQAAVAAVSIHNTQPWRPTIDDLRAAAATGGAELAVLDPAQRAAVLGLTWTADVRRRTDPAYRQELLAWTAGDADRRDGVPPRLHGPRSRTSTVTVLDFGLAVPPYERTTARFEARPQLVVLRSIGHLDAVTP